MLRVFYAAGPGNVIEAHKYWRKGQNDPSQVSLTYSGQFAEFCEQSGATAYIVAWPGEASNIYSDDRFTIEHLPKPRSGSSLSYFLREALFALRLLRRAIRFRTQVAIMHSATGPAFLLTMFRICGIHVVPVLHNTIWPKGYPPQTTLRKLVHQCDGLFFRYCASAVIGVSPECLRQVAQLSKSRRPLLVEMRPQFQEEFFSTIPQPSSERPFRILFAGRIQANKGVFDLLKIAHMVEAKRPGLIRWEVCGDGADIGSMRAMKAALKCEHIVKIHGHVHPPTLRDMLSICHAAIIPTKSNFTEGMAKTSIEPVLAGRPIITSAVVPAIELLSEACIEAKTDDVASYADAVVELATNADKYVKLQHACAKLSKSFYDRRLTFNSALIDLLGERYDERMSSLVRFSKSNRSEVGLMQHRIDRSHAA